MTTLSLDDAIARFPDLDPGAKAKIEFTAISSPELVGHVMRRFLLRGLAQGWYFDEALTWHQATEGETPRSVEAMVEQFKELVFVQKDGKAARTLRDRFLGFAAGAEHAPILEGLYDAGKAIDDQGALIDGAALAP